MAKRSVSKSSHTSIRLAPDVVACVENAAGVADWSTAKVVNHFVRIGFAASAKRYSAVHELVAEYHGAMKIHAIEYDNARRLADVKRSLAAERRPAAPKPGKAPKASKASAASPPPPPPPAGGSAK